MKKGIIGIALILFGILLQLCSSGLEIAALALGIIGLITTIVFCLKD